jgi:hypothetical protein
MDQSVYIDRTLTRIRMQDAKPERLPLNPSIKLIPAAFENGKPADQKLYQEITGSLNHLAGYSRPDIAFAVSQLCQFNSKPIQLTWQQLFISFVI